MAEGRILYRPTEAAETLGLSRTRLYQLLAAGEIGSVKIGTSRRIPAADLEAFVNRKRQEPAAVQPLRTVGEVARGAA
jgi:excisionase family DNA binding protein